MLKVNHDVVYLLSNLDRSHVQYSASIIYLKQKTDFLKALY